MAALDLVVKGLADIMQQTRRASVTFTPISPASRPASQATSMLWVRAFWPKLVRYFSGR